MTIGFEMIDEIKGIVTGRISRFAVVICLIIMAVNAKADTVREKQDTFSALQKRELTVSCDDDYLPYSALDANGKPIGMSVDIANAMAKELGIKIKIKLLPWARAQKEYSEGKIDMLFNYSSSWARMQYSNFTSPYASAPVIVFRRASAKEPKQLSDLDGKKVLSVMGDQSIYVIHIAHCKAEIIEAPSYKSVFKILAADPTIDYAIVDKNAGNYLLKKQGLTHKIFPTEFQIYILNYAIGVPKTSRGLTRMMSMGLAAILQNGEFVRIQKKWLEEYDEDLQEKSRFLEYAIYVTIVLAVLAIGFIIWNRTLRKRVTAETQNLENLNSMLELSKEHYRGFLQMNPDIMFILDSDRCFVDYYGGENDDLAQYNIDAQNFLGHKVGDIFPPYLANMFEQKIDALLRTNKTQIYTYQLPSKGGEISHYECKLKLCNSDEIIAVVRDITSSKRTEEQLNMLNHELERRYEKYMQLNSVLQSANEELETVNQKVVNDKVKLDLLMDTLPNMVYRCAYDGKYTMLFLNKGVLGLTGYTIDELLNNRVISYTDIIHPDDVPLVNAIIRSSIRSKRYFVIDYRIINKFGEIVNVRERGSVILSDNGEISELQGIVSDVTDFENSKAELANQIAKYEAQNKEYEKLNAVLQQKNSELSEAKRKAEASDSLKSAFIRNISHEIRTPLNGIIGYSSLLNMEDITTEEIAEYTSIINKSGSRLIEIVNNVMDISQLESKQLELIPKNFDLNVTIKSVYQYYSTMASETNIAFNLTFDDQPVELFSDEDRITQVLNKLLSNAFKFTQSGTIELGGGINQDEFMVVIYIKDTGIGIDDEQQETLFNTFTQGDMRASREYGGAGLGLAISAGLIHLLGGKIRCESALGKGTTFSIYLPLM